MAEMTVILKQHTQYPVIIEAGALEQLPLYLKRQGLGPKVMLVTDENVNPLYAQASEKHLQEAGFDADILELPAGERYKVYPIMGRVYSILKLAGLDRSSCIVALGGGVVGDIAGFAAATWQRGIALVQVPTTLLAQVDSCLGGKVGVNHLGLKNLIGAFYQPNFVLVDPTTLITLPDRDYRAGLAEVVKTALLGGLDFFEFIKRQAVALLEKDMSALEETIRRCLTYKAACISKDPEDQAGRQALNLGHTLGHAIEALAGGAYTHGEAVSVGLVYALRLSVQLGLPQSVLHDTITLLQQFGLPTAAPGLDMERLQDLFTRDKKVRQGVARWVLLPALGRPQLQTELPKGWQNILAELVEP
ncbi:MAG: 3-dehydroquinate synthase [Firmicutes bacterium]|nr:3-dehydroquinate synthase [Bacillota bacterium]